MAKKTSATKGGGTSGMGIGNLVPKGTKTGYSYTPQSSRGQAMTGRKLGTAEVSKQSFPSAPLRYAPGVRGNSAPAPAPQARVTRPQGGAGPSGGGGGTRARAALIPGAGGMTSAAGGTGTVSRKGPYTNVLTPSVAGSDRLGTALAASGIGTRPTPTYKPTSAPGGQRIGGNRTAAQVAADPMNWSNIAKELGNKGDPAYAQYKTTPASTTQTVSAGPTNYMAPSNPALTPGVAPRTPTETAPIRRRQANFY